MKWGQTAVCVDSPRVGEVAMGRILRHSSRCPARHLGPLAGPQGP